MRFFNFILYYKQVTFCWLLKSYTYIWLLKNCDKRVLSDGLVCWSSIHWPTNNFSVRFPLRVCTPTMFDSFPSIKLSTLLVIWPSHLNQPHTLHLSLYSLFKPCYFIHHPPADTVTSVWHLRLRTFRFSEMNSLVAASCSRSDYFFPFTISLQKVCYRLCNRILNDQTGSLIC